MSDIYTVTYAWSEEREEFEEERPMEFPLVRHFLSTQKDSYPFAVINEYKEKLDGYEGRFATSIYLRDHEEDASFYYELDTLDEAKQCCEYRLLGGKEPDCLKISEVETKLDRDN